MADWEGSRVGRSRGGGSVDAGGLSLGEGAETRGRVGALGTLGLVEEGDFGGTVGAEDLGGLYGNGGDVFVV
jgi:hypothetical protein